MERLLVINPGSTSTKIAVYEDKNQLWAENISHTLEELTSYKTVYDQLEMRTAMVTDCLKKHGEDLKNFTAIASRGGNVPPVKAGAYEVNEYMLECLEFRPQDQHASNVGAGIAYKLAVQAGIKAYIYDAVTVDEMLPVNTITGFNGIRRPARGHNLNMRAAALKLCRERKLDYKNQNIIVAHLGGGITLSLHSKGRIIDLISDEEGPMSPERAGGLPYYGIIRLAYSGSCTYEELMKAVQRRGGMISYFGTADMREIEERVRSGDEEVSLVYQAMALSVVKWVGSLSAEMSGRIDFIILTGGLAHSERFTSIIKDKVSFIAQVEIIPGENEMQALAEGILRVVKGEEKAEILERESE